MRRDNDSRIYPTDTYMGMRELGFSVLPSALFTWAVHFTLLLPWMTSDSWLLHPYLPIHLKNIHKAKHGSDTDTFDEQGRFVPQVRQRCFAGPWTCERARRRVAGWLLEILKA
jgi:peroxygenase